jgi:2-keto-3-deoxy-L-fuconate dehydrogenase
MKVRTLPETTTQQNQPRIALVTGGGSGIGEAICRKLPEAGFRVIMADLDMAAAKRVAAEIPNGTPLHLDVGSEENVAQAAASISELNVLVNNAGIGLVGSIAETETADFQRIMRVNVNSVFCVTRSLLPKLLAVRGSIIYCVRRRLCRNQAPFRLVRFKGSRSSE